MRDSHGATRPPGGMRRGRGIRRRLPELGVYPLQGPHQRLQALRQGPPGERRADGEDPHGRMDAGDHRAPDDEVRDARQLVRDPRQAPGKAELERGARRHPRLADRPPRRAVLAHRGVRRRLPDAPAPARRLAAALGGLHIPQQGIHLRDGQAAVGSYRTVAGHGGKQLVALFIQMA